jgi:hypothetical protein
LYVEDSWEHADGFDGISIPHDGTSVSLYVSRRHQLTGISDQQLTVLPAIEFT